MPFFMRGPGVPSGLVSDYPAAVVDVAATLINLAGQDAPGMGAKANATTQWTNADTRTCVPSVVPTCMQPARRPPLPGVSTAAPRPPLPSLQL